MRPGFFICICPDPEIINDFVKKTLKGFEGKWKKKVFWGDDEDLSSFWGCFRTSNLLGIKQAVVLRGAQKVGNGFWDRLSHFLSKFYPNVCIFICIESEWVKGAPKGIGEIKSKRFYKIAEKKKWIFSHPGVNERFLDEYLNEWANKKQIKISPRVRPILKELLPRDLKGIKQELKKIEISINDYKELDLTNLAVICPSLEYEVFDLINSIEDGRLDKKKWSVLLGPDFSTYETIIPIFYLFLREARIFWKLLHGEHVSLPNWVIRKKTSLARKLGEDGLVKLWDIILDADLRLKTSKLSSAEVFQETVVRLKILFS